MLLRHTEQTTRISRARHIATDAVINAIIHRCLGEAYSSMMATYYAHADGVQRLLRQPREGETRRANLPKALQSGSAEVRFAAVWKALYAGSLNVDDIESVAQEVIASSGESDGAVVQILLGNHDDRRRCRMRCSMRSTAAFGR